MPEHRCVVNYCCCGCTLKDGSLAIGITTMVLHLLASFYCIYMAIKEDDVSIWYAFVINLFVIIVSWLLIQGVRQERQCYVMVWVWTMAVVTVLSIIGSFVAMAMMGFVVGITGLLFWVFYIYLVVVVRSYGLTLGSSPEVA